MRRLFLNSPLENEFIISGDDAKHLLYAMRVRPEQTFTVVDIHGKIANAQVISCTKDTVKMCFLNYIENADTEPPIDVILAQCLPKADKMDYIVQKAVELGVNTIVPVISQHCVVKYDEKKKKLRREKWQKTANEAAKQCGRTILPKIEEITYLQDLVQNYTEYTKLVCYESENKMTMKNLFSVNKESDKYLILIGPEGGFDLKEIHLCNNNDFTSISLGTRILRTETASLAALSILMYEKGDL